MQKCSSTLLNFLVVAGSTLLAVSLSSCGDEELNKFVENIITGYSPFETMYVRDQMRVGFTQLRGRDYSFNRFVVGKVSEKFAATRRVDFSYTHGQMANLSAKVKSIVAAGLDYSQIETLHVRAKGIRVYSFPSTYTFVLPVNDPSNSSNVRVLKAVASVDTLEFEFVSKSAAGARANLDSAWKKIQLGVDVHRRSDLSFSVEYINRPIAYLDEEVLPSNVQVDSTAVVFYGVVPTEMKDTTFVEVAYSTGMQPVTAPVNVYGRYSISVIARGVASISLKGITGRGVIYTRNFNPVASLEYDFPQ